MDDSQSARLIPGFQEVFVQACDECNRGKREYDQTAV